MEDIGTIIWAVALVGAGIYSLVTKAKKAQGAAPKPQTEEDSWNDEDSSVPESSLEKTLRELLGEDAIPRRVKAPKPVSNEATSEDTEEVFTYDREASIPKEVFSYDTAAEKPQELFTYDAEAAQPHEIFTYDTNHSQEVTDHATTTRERLFSRNTAPKGSDNVASITTIQRTKHAADSSVTLAHEEIEYDYSQDLSEEIGAAEHIAPQATTTPHNANSALNALLNEEFDLRRAVIYTELLKPKFEA